VAVEFDLTAFLRTRIVTGSLVDFAWYAFEPARRA
jgi:hypothetical protein